MQSHLHFRVVSSRADTLVKVHPQTEGNAFVGHVEDQVVVGHVVERGGFTVEGRPLAQLVVVAACVLSATVRAGKYMITLWDPATRKSPMFNMEYGHYW